MTGTTPTGTRGGARPGAGRKPKPPAYTDERDPLEFLLDVMQGKVAANQVQVRAAIAAVQYLHTRTKDGGKKERAQRRALEVAEDSPWARLLPPPATVRLKELTNRDD